MAIEKHECAGGEFHTTTDFLDCECGDVIPNLTKLSGNGNDIVFCRGCGTEHFPEDLADARVEEIVKAVVDVPRLQEQVRLLREALGEARSAYTAMSEAARWPVDVHAMDQIDAALEATKET